MNFGNIIIDVVNKDDSRVVVFYIFFIKKVGMIWNKVYWLNLELYFENFIYKKKILVLKIFLYLKFE